MAASRSIVPRTARMLILGCALVLAMAGCVTVPVAAPPSTPSPTTDLGPAQRLAAMELAPLKNYGGDEDMPVAFLGYDRNVYCALTTKQGGWLNNPVDDVQRSGDPSDHELEVPVVYCELGAYPEPKKVTSDCHGTGRGFKGGTVLLTAEQVTYGGCRIGMTAMETEFGARAVPSDGPVASLPRLPRGQALQRDGFKCGADETGMICMNLDSGTGFIIDEEHYRVFG